MTEGEIKTLMQRIAYKNDQQAFKQLFWHYYGSLFYFANSFVKCKEVAEEIVEDAFVSVWNRRERLPGIANLKVYLYVVVKNLCINHVNRSGSYRFEDLNQLDVPLVSLLSTPEDTVIASEMLQDINRAVGELPPKCRMIYKLVKEDGLRYKEVADILQISPRTVEHQIAKALRKMADAVHIDFKTGTRKHCRTAQ